MTLTISGGTRPKLSTSLSLSTNVTADNPVETSNYFSVRVKNPSFTPAEFTVTANITTASDTITTTNSGFANIRVGDILNSTSLDTDSVVLTKSVDNNTITVSLDATGTATGESITVTPGTIAATYYYVKLEHEFTGSKLKITPTLYLFDGTQVAEGAALDNDDNALISNATSTQAYTPVTIDLDTYYTNARLPRTNS
jgi:hypothetical protein